MRQRLSAEYTVWPKIALTILLFATLLVTDIYGTVLRNLPDLVVGHYVAIFLFIFLCYKFIDFLLRERIVVEFDSDNLYIIDKKYQQEEPIPLQKILNLSVRPAYFHIGRYWFFRHSLTFIDNLNQEQKISFNIQTGRKSTKNFTALVKEKNPNFRYKNWTHPFDFGINNTQQ